VRIGRSARALVARTLYHPARVYEKFLQTLINGLAVGSLYALIALGYTMVYGILKFINFAHSDIFVLGAWVSFAAASVVGLGTNAGATVPAWEFYALGAVGVAGLAVMTWEYFKRRGRGGGLPLNGRGAPMVGVCLWGFATLGLVYLARFGHKSEWPGLLVGGLVLVVAMMACGAAGFSLERLAYKPLRSAPRLNVLITAIGVSLFLQNLGQLNWMFGTRPQPMPAIIEDRPLVVLAGAGTVNEVQLRTVDVLGAGTAVVLMVLLDFLVFHTRLGRAMRAVSFNERTAALMGIPVDRIISFTFVLGASLAAAAGFLYAQKYPGLNQTAAATWVLLGLKAFVAAVVGGIGNIRGAMLGGILIGLLEFFGTAYISPALRDVYVFSALIIVLLVRPAGLLGSTVAEKV